MTRHANQLCPLCGGEGEVESRAAGREHIARCSCCLVGSSFAPSGSGTSARSAVDRWIRAAERLRRRLPIRGAA